MWQSWIGGKAIALASQGGVAEGSTCLNQWYLSERDSSLTKTKKCRVERLARFDCDTRPRRKYTSRQFHCILCEESYSLTEKDALLKHLIIEHKLVIADVKRIAEFRRYILYWKKRFPEQPITDFCSVIRTNSEGPVEGQEDYFLLCDVFPEDRLLREQLQQKRLVSGLKFYQQVKLVNFMRREIHQCRCYRCKEKFPSKAEVLKNIMDLKHIMALQDKSTWDQPQ
ncbi:UNVERIFIED_CONTAM: hypothetical protein FKN15_063504 [Acipenser sinensis]